MYIYHISCIYDRDVLIRVVVEYLVLTRLKLTYHCYNHYNNDDKINF